MDSTNSTTKSLFNSSFSDEGRPKSYFSYTTAVLQASFSDDKRKLNQLIIDPRFKEILAEWLGFEAGNFYFFDPRLNSFQFFHQALSDGIEIPWFVINGTAPASKRFIALERTVREKRNLRSKQQTHMNDPKEPTTALLCFENLLPDKKIKSRRSKIEIEEQWILIPRGERALFCFEWQVLKRLEKMQCQSYKQAESMIASSGFIDACWADIYDNPKYNQMRGEDERDYKEAISWLREIFDHQNDYDYLWDNSYPLNWFALHRTKVETLTQDSFDEGINFDLLRKFAALIVRPYLQSNANATLESSNFYKRCRFSPPMELLFGSHNLIAFLLTVPVEASLIEASGSPYAFLLGSFHESKVCRLYAPELKNIFYLLAIRDMILFSNLQLKSAQESINKTSAIMATINDDYFLHEFRSPLAKLNLYLSKLEGELQKRKITTDLTDELFSRIYEHRDRLMRTTATLLSITLSLSGKLEIANAISTIDELCKEVFKDLRISKNVQIVKDFPNSEVLIRLDRNILRLVISTIISNALDAMRHKGQLTLSIQEVDKQVVLSITDTGPGIRRDILNKLFTPRVTTKKIANKGLGLGLFIAKHLMQLLEGDIRAENTSDGAYACFSLTFSKYTRGG